MKITEDTVTLSTGKEFYANNGIIGIGPDLDISEGYDGGIRLDDWSGENPSQRYTPSELAEIADHMIQTWQAFKAKHSGNIQ